MTPAPPEKRRDDNELGAQIATLFVCLADIVLIYTAWKQPSVWISLLAAAVTVLAVVMITTRIRKRRSPRS